MIISLIRAFWQGWPSKLVLAGRCISSLDTSRSQGTDGGKVEIQTILLRIATDGLDDFKIYKESCRERGIIAVFFVRHHLEKYE